MQILLRFLVCDGWPLELQELLFSQCLYGLLDSLAVENKVHCLLTGQPFGNFPLLQGPSYVRKVGVVLESEEIDILRFELLHPLAQQVFLYTIDA